MIAGREIALGPLTVSGAATWDVIEAAGAAEFDSIGLRVFDDASSEPCALVADPSFRLETIARLNHHGVGVLEVEVVRLNERTDARQCRAAFECAAALGARAVLVVGWDQDEARSVRNFAAICEEAAPFGLRPALEFMAFSAVGDLAQALDVVEKAGHEEGGVLIDALHLCRSGAKPADVAAVTAASPERVVFAQLCDAPHLGPPAGVSAIAEASRNRLAPGDGELPLAQLLEALPSKVPLSVEAPVPSLAHLSVAERARYMMEATRRLVVEAGGGE